MSVGARHAHEQGIQALCRDQAAFLRPVRRRQLPVRCAVTVVIVARRAWLEALEIARGLPVTAGASLVERRQACRQAGRQAAIAPVQTVRQIHAVLT